MLVLDILEDILIDLLAQGLVVGVGHNIEEGLEELFYNTLRDFLVSNVLRHALNVNLHKIEENPLYHLSFSNIEDGIRLELVDWLDHFPGEMLAELDLLLHDVSEEHHELVDSPIINLFPFAGQDMEHCPGVNEVPIEIELKDSGKLRDVLGQ